MGKPTYITREQLMAASEIHTTTVRAAQIDRLIHSASRGIDQRFHRHFYPLTESVTFAFAGGGLGFWLNRDLFSLISASEDGVTVADPADVELYPSQHGPPYSWVGLAGSTVEVTGVWGYSADEAVAGAVAGAIDDTTETVDVSDAARVGVGDLIRVDSERMIVTDRQLVDTAVDLTATAGALASDETLAVTDGTGVHPGEVITIGAERMLVTATVINDVIVKRAWDGSVITGHDPADDVFAARRLTVERGAVGTTASSHSQSAPVFRNVAPEPVQLLCLAEALTSLHQETSGYGRVIGGGEAQMEARGVGLRDARQQAEPYRRMRMAHV